MPPIITRRNSPEKSKPFTWSYSRLKNFETCPRRHFQIDITKQVKEPESDALLWGNQVHKYLALRLAKDAKLPQAMEEYEAWCQKILVGEGTIHVEQKLAITRDFGPCGYFDKNVWFRAVGDVIKVNSAVALIVDWKTGKIIEDSCQLALSAQCVFAHYPEVQAVRSEFVWLKEDAQTSQVFRRNDMPGVWNALLPRVRTLEHAHETTSYPAKPNGLCKRWCPVTQCPHCGE